MGVFLAIAMLGSLASAQVSTADAPPAQAETLPSTPPSGDSSIDLMAMPKGKSTVIGGAITAVDPVTDQMTLRVFGGRPMKILYDERTQVYRDGVKGSLHDLKSNDHASVETMLDGTTVFARSVHMLSQVPEGDCEGQVQAYNPATRELTVSDTLSRESIRLHVPEGTKLLRQGQAAVTATAGSEADLVKGTLISAQFQSDNKGEGVASRISILATPGSDFAFVGSVTFLDLHAKQFVVMDVSDGKSYKIFFDPGRLPVTKELHEGDKVKVNAGFDGLRYIASTVALN